MSLTLERAGDSRRDGIVDTTLALVILNPKSLENPLLQEGLLIENPDTHNSGRDKPVPPQHLVSYYAVRMCWCTGCFLLVDLPQRLITLIMGSVNEHFSSSISR